MKRTQNRKETVRRERIIMALSSVFVLAALVCVGIYMRGTTIEEQNDGYSVDFAELEPDISDKYAQLQGSIDDALDYMPREEILEEGFYVEEADSGKVEIGKLKEDIKNLNENLDSMKISAEENVIEEGVQTEVMPEVKSLGNPAFSEVAGFHMPVVGNVLMHYDMEHTVYFATLDQYKYNPATIISASVGDPVYACADATVSDIYTNEEIGIAVVLDLGNGYEVTYGQIKEVIYKEGTKVSRGTKIAEIAEPTKYYTVEGPNLYFAMKKDGEVKSPEALLPIE